MNINDRFRVLIELVAHPSRRFKILEEATKISTGTWRSWWNRGAAQMIAPASAARASSTWPCQRQRSQLRPGRRPHAPSGSTSPCRRRDGARVRCMHGAGQDLSAPGSWRPPPAAAPGTRLVATLQRAGQRRASASSSWPASTSPATVATPPIDVGTALRDLHIVLL